MSVGRLIKTLCGVIVAVVIPPYYPDHPVTREDWAKYLDAATELDGKIGKALRQLEADGLADDTIIIFFGDNGQAHVRGKQFVYESGLHVPLIIRWPKNFRPVRLVLDTALLECRNGTRI